MNASTNPFPAWKHNLLLWCCCLVPCLAGGSVWASAAKPSATAETVRSELRFSSEAAGGASLLGIGQSASVGRPVITQEFTDLTVVAGANIQFIVTGTAVVSYVWKKDGVVIPNETRSDLYLPNVQRSAAGYYTVTLSNAAGSVTGRPSKLTVLSPPVAQGQTVTTAEDTPVAITLSASDADGDALTYRVVSGPSRGKVTGTSPNVRYEPELNFNGEDRFWFRANDGQYDSSAAEVRVVVSSVNDAPELPVIGDQVIGLNREWRFWVGGYDVDGAGEVLTYTLVQGPTGLVVDGASGLLRWTPSFANSPSTNRVEVRVRDQAGLSASRQFRVIVQAGAPVITEGPASQRVTAGKRLDLRVVAEGTAPLSYQWRKDGVNLPGATTSAFSLQPSALGDSGNYDVVVSNGVGSVASPVAEVTVELPGLVWLPPGVFRMGSPTNEVGRGNDEGPVTTVRLSAGIWIGKQEVTQGEYEGVMAMNPSRVKGAGSPVSWVSWEEATDYCGRLTAREQTAGRLPAGYRYRLPSEAEWEYACRAGTTTRFSFGDNVSALEDYGWHGGNSDGAAQLAGWKLPNAWGLFDLHGNVGEWCGDWYTAALPGGAVVDPRGPVRGTQRVIRGGDYASGAERCRSAERDAAWPTMRAGEVGFRVVLEPAGALGPEIVVQPLGKTVNVGETLVLSVVARGTGPLSYRWQKDGADLVDGAGVSGSGTANLKLSGMSAAMAGKYRVIVKNLAGQVTSNEAEVKLVTVPVVANMVWIAPGTFLMGSPSSELDRYSEEGPQTRVTLTTGFWMGKYEVTQREYLELMGSNPSYFTGDLNRPVEQVTWDEANSYCAKVTERERVAGRLLAAYVYRLPTEAEWEYACRAGTTTRFSYGDDPSYSQLGQYAWYDENSWYSTKPGGVSFEWLGKYYTPHPVGTKLPNPWGLYDMHGNVSEWCSDWWANLLPGGERDGSKGADIGPTPCDSRGQV